MIRWISFEVVNSSHLGLPSYGLDLAGAGSTRSHLVCAFVGFIAVVLLLLEQVNRLVVLL